MENVKVSVIMPVYNGEKFLEENLLSLVKQSLKEIEFIIVNDGSTDNSLNILKAFKEVFPDKIVLVDSKKNRGPGGARNLGLMYAKGEYIGFIDADDKAHKDMFNILYNEAKKDDYDIVICGFYDKEREKDCPPYELKGELDDQRLFHFIENSFYIWDKLYKRKIIEDMNVKFRENVQYEDTDFVIDACLRAKKVSSIPNILYYYNYNEQSATKTNLLNVEKMYSMTGSLIESLNARFDYSDRKELLEVIKKQLTAFYIRRSMSALFIKTDLSFEDFKSFDLFARKYMPEYYLLKENSTDFEALIFNNLTENIEESYNNLIKFKNKIKNGELMQK